eukprot:scaffold6566_cov49-Attheya_sp.AAC.1
MPWSSASTAKAAVVAFDLSVNHLQRIELAGGRTEQVGAAEDFLPIVLPNSYNNDEQPVNSAIDLRFRLKGIVGGSFSAMQDISAYQIVAMDLAQHTIWDSGKVDCETEQEGMSSFVSWGGPELAPGTIVSWQVKVWDMEGAGPSASGWSKFGVGPPSDGWNGEWISHSLDIKKYLHKDQRRFLESRYKSEKVCRIWTKRRPLPIARGKVEVSKSEAPRIVSALLVATGLGAFSMSLDGQELSSTSMHSPSLTDVTQRVFYRGFDVTSFFRGKPPGSHVMGVVLGSGWWDPRPIQGDLVNHHYMPQGPLTLIAELHLTYDDGTTQVKTPTGENAAWQLGKGYIRDSDIFSGETIDLDRYKKLKGWDSPKGWDDYGLDPKTGVTWTEPQLYVSDTTTAKFRRLLEKRAVKRDEFAKATFKLAPIGKLIPTETPPVMPIERIPVETTTDLGNGRWLLDFGRGIAGTVHFDSGLPPPIIPEDGYPRAHSLIQKEGKEEDFVTVVYGDSLTMEYGDINLVLVASYGLHDGGPRHESKESDTQERAGACYIKEHEGVMTQRDIFMAPKDKPELFADAKTTLFTSHGFRFAEVCCTEEPPEDVYSVLYRTAFQEWGHFDSSNVNINGAYELTKNALNSNMQGTQTDCPHRERLQYGGDLIANSPSSMHMFDLSAFYRKVVHDWTETQFSNGAYTETSTWHDLLADHGFGEGSGETVWASLPPVLTARHMQHYGDIDFVRDTFSHHVEWCTFLSSKFEKAIQGWFGYAGDNLEGYRGSENVNGLGDWLSLQTIDTYLTHHAFYMATARSIAYMAHMLEKDGSADEETSFIGKEARSLARKIKDHITNKYLNDNTYQVQKGWDVSPGPDLPIFTRMVPGKSRCDILRNWLQVAGSGHDVQWTGDEEKLFMNHLPSKTSKALLKKKIIGEDEDGMYMNRRSRHSTAEGILGIRYSLKTLSDFGFHNIALSRVSNGNFPGFAYMMSFNATTMWETWWRSEDLYSRNHPMLGAVAEWASSSVAGVSLAPTTTGGKDLLFWPRIPTNADVVVYASATQGTKRGDAAIAWRFEGAKLKNARTVKVRIRILAPPGSNALFRLPIYGCDYNATATVSYARTLPDLNTAKSNAASTCSSRRKSKNGFSYNWEYNSETEKWNKSLNKKAIGTPCESFLFDKSLADTNWSDSKLLTLKPEAPFKQSFEGVESEKLVELTPGLYDIVIEKWKLQREIRDQPGYGEYVGSLGSYCSDQSTSTWNIEDATHLI